MSKSDNPDEILHRFLDLANQADRKGIQGVYNINKGYAVFKQINILYQNEDYAIISTGTTYGLSLYDHIVLQGDLVKENQIIR